MKENQIPQIAVSANASLFLYLKERIGDRKSKVEAYCDLLDKASKRFVSRFLRNKDYEIGTNQCHVTITDLAAEWHWHRATVRTYLERMEAFGLIQKITLPKSIVITIPESMSLSELKEGFTSLEYSESEAQILDKE